MKLILVRHGETEANKARILQGWSGGKLTGEGFRQADLVGKRLAKMKIGHVYCSDLIRARQTAAGIMKYINAPIEFDKDVRELNIGMFENGDYLVLKEAFENCDDAMKFRPEGGETLEELRLRLRRFCSRIRKEHKDDNVLVITHGGAIAHFLLLLVEKLEREGKTYYDLPQGNTAVNILEMKDKPKLVLQNCTKHLE